MLRRYLQIQAEEQRLKEEKAALQTSLAGYMDQNQTGIWLPVVDGLKLKVLSRSSVVIEYDETILRERLGERYAAILAPDIRKIRQNLRQVEAVLTPILDIIGSPSPDKVKDSIEKGLTRKEEFVGAFDKTIKHKISVTKISACVAG